MNGDFPVVIGRLALSRAGRDKGRCFVIVGIADEASVWIADGDLRKVDRPKRKKIMHLRLQKDVSSLVADRVADGKPLYDKELQDVIAAWELPRGGDENLDVGSTRIAREDSAWQNKI